MAMIKKEIKSGMKPSPRQIREIEKAASKPVFYDEEAPELTVDQYAQMAKLAKEQRDRMKKPVIAIRISPDTLAKAKATGKGYTGFLSRLLDNAINDPKLVAKSL